MGPPAAKWNETVFWALDLETGELSPRRGEILAVGMVPIRQGAIRLAEGYSTLVRPPWARPVSADSRKVHQILPAESRAAPPLREVLPRIDERIREGVLVIHHARLDVAFLKRAYEDLGQPWPRPKVVDTVALLLRLASRQRFLGGSHENPLLNLNEARRALGLPGYPAHDALTDAVAAAELFLLLRSRLAARTLRDLV